MKLTDAEKGRALTEFENSASAKKKGKTKKKKSK
jgi:hypothetical protein